MGTISDFRGDVSRSLATLFGGGTLGGLTDAQLLQRSSVRDGADSELAFTVLVERHGPMVLRVCRSIAGDSGEDAFQATFLVLARKAGSLRVGDSLAPWLHQVAYRVATSARTAQLRRQRHERLAAHPGEPVVHERAPDDLAAIVHEEIQALPSAYRSVVALCYLQGLTHAQAAERLGCPAGTVQSRLARGRQRLRDRLVRRGLDPSAAIVSAASGSVRSVPVPLLDSTARIATLLRARNVVEIASPGAARLFQDATVKGGVRVFKNLIIGVATAAALAVADPGHSPRSGKDDFVPAQGKASPTATLPANDVDRDDGPERVLPRLDFGTLRVGGLCEVVCGFDIEVDDEEAVGKSLKVEPPSFLKVESTRLWSRPLDFPGRRFVEFKVVLDTTRVGDLAGRLKIECDKHKVEQPVRARILPADAERPKLLVIGQRLLGRGQGLLDRPESARPWLELVESAGLDVSYVDLEGNPLRRRGPERDSQGGPTVPEWLRRYDVVLLDDGGVSLSEHGDVPILQEYVRGGGRLIVSSAGRSSNRVANDLAKPFGIALDDDPMNRALASGPAHREAATIDEAVGRWVRPDPLTAGVEALAFKHPTAVRVIEDQGLAGRRDYLVQDPEVPTRGLAVVARDGGELIVIGQPILSYFFSDQAEPFRDDARLLRNLLSRSRSAPR